MNRFPLFLLIILVAAIASCDSGKVRILSKGKMEKVLYDYHLAQGMMNMNDPESGRLIYAVFEKHGITEEEFDSSLVYYNIHQEDMSDIYTHLRERYEEEEKNLRLQSGSSEMSALLSDSRDTTDIWSGAAIIVLRDNPMYRSHSFSIKTDTSFYQGDQFILTLNNDMIRQNQDNQDDNVVVSVSVRYDDGFTIADTRSFYSSGPQQLKISSDPKRHISQVNGFFHYQTGEKARALAVIRDIRLVRIHTQHPDMVVPDSALIADSLRTDSLMADSLREDSLRKDSANQIKHEPRLTPEQLRNSTASDKADIITAPKIRTRNSIGPRRRKNVRK